MIEGEFFTDGDLDITLETGINQTGLSGWVRVKFPNGPTLEYPWTRDHFSRVRFSVPKADNVYPGELQIQAFSVSNGQTIPGEIETVVIRPALAVTP